MQRTANDDPPPALLTKQGGKSESTTNESSVRSFPKDSTAETHMNGTSMFAAAANPRPSGLLNKLKFN